MGQDILSQEETNKLHRKKMIAPIVVATLLGLYYVGFAVLCFCVQMPLVLKLIMGIIPLVLAGVIIYVLVERIQEIRSGEEDDLSKY